MAAIVLLARADLRKRLLALLALGLLVGLIGTAVLGSLAAARRTSTAFDRLEAASHVDDARVLAFGRVGAGADLVDLPAVEEGWVASAYVSQLAGQRLQYVAFLAGPERPDDLYQPRVVRGRAANPTEADEVVITEQFARGTGFDVGDTLDLSVLTRDEVAQFDTGFGAPDGPTVHLDIVGVVRAPGTENDLANAIGTPALAEQLDGDLVGGEVAFLRLKDGVAGAPALRAQVDELAADLAPLSEDAAEFAPFEVAIPSEAQAQVAAATSVLVGGLLAFSAIALLVGVFAVVQAFARYHAASAEAQHIEEALGLTRMARSIARTLPAVVPALVGTALAVGGAIAASRYTPIGSLAYFEPDPGVDVNLALLAAGALALVLVVLAAAGATSVRAARQHRASPALSSSTVADRLASVGSSAPTVLGVRFAFERGRGRTAVPVRSALIGAVVGLAGVVAVVAFSSSLDRLLTTPARYGWQGDFTIADVKADTEAALETDDEVAAVAVLQSALVRTADGDEVQGYGFDTRKGTLGWTMLDGRMPTSRDEVAIGSRVADRNGIGVGDSLSFDEPNADDPVPLNVVGIGLGPVISNGLTGADVVFTVEGLERLGTSAPFAEAYVKLAPGVDATAYVDKIAGDLEINGQAAPQEVMNLRQLGRLPEVLGAFLGLLAIVAIANALIVGVRRRRRDLAVLRTMGFTGRQLGGTIAIMALATVAVGIVIGVPIGLLVGGLVWRQVAEAAHVAADLALPLAELAIVIPVAIAIGVLLATWPARRATVVRPAVALRSE